MNHNIDHPSIEISPLSTVRVVAVAASVQCAGALPMFLTGALAVQIQREFGFGAIALGTATGCFVLARALSSSPIGILVDKIGARRSMRLSAAGCALTGFVVAVVVQNWTMLVGALAFAGCVHAISQPAANRFVLRSVPSARLGIAFGLKQAGPPSAIILAGLALPALAMTIGWRWGFGIAAILSLLTYVAVPRRVSGTKSKPASQQHATRRVRGLGMVMVGTAFSLAATNATHTFIVSSGVSAGLNITLAGLLLSMGGVVAIVVRIIAGIWADRYEAGHLTLVARMLFVGVLGYALLATGQAVLFVLGTVLAYGSTWGMTGVLYMAIVRRYHQAPAAASGHTIAVGSIGGFCGPIAFGAVVETFGYPVAWLMTAGWAGIAAIMIGRSSAARW